MVKIKNNILLAPYTTFKIGGPAKYFAEAKTAEEIQELCAFAKQNDLPIFVLGGGSNVLISDEGFDGLVIKIYNSKFLIHDSKISAESGMPLAKLVSEATQAGLTGMEWAIGIPGTIGGAVCSNSGAFGRSISDVFESVKVFDKNMRQVLKFKIKDCKFAYRNSIFSAKGGSAFGGKHNPNFVILEAEFILKKESLEKIRETIKNNLAQRRNSYSAGRKCAGSFFKNIEWSRLRRKEEWIKEFPELKRFENKPKIAVGFLIEFLGLKGQKIGGAAVSKEHANFILNTGHATAEQVVLLANLIKEYVYSRYGFNLEEEVQLVGFD